MNPYEILQNANKNKLKQISIEVANKIREDYQSLFVEIEDIKVKYKILWDDLKEIMEKDIKDLKELDEKNHLIVAVDVITGYIEAYTIHMEIMERDEVTEKYKNKQKDILINMLKGKK